MKRAIVSMKRRLGKTMLLFFLVFILGSVISGAISITQAVKQTEVNLKAQMPAIATIDVDHQAVMAYQNETNEVPIPVLRAEEVRRIGGLPYVKHFDYSLTFEFVNEKLESYWNPASGRDRPILRDGERFRAKGVYQPEILDLQEGIIDLVQGRYFSKEEMEKGQSALISQQFAQLNNLTLGSVFTLKSRVYDWQVIDSPSDMTEENVMDTLVFELEVIGIFEVLHVPNTGIEALDEPALMELKNQIYVPIAVTEAAQTFFFESLQETNHYEGAESARELASQFVLHDPMDILTFREAANEELPAFWHIVDLSVNFNQMTVSMATMSELAQLVFWTAIGATFIILSLLMILFLRDRKHELGLYLALGEKKIKIAFQIFIEVLLPSMGAFALSTVVGSFLVREISHSMLERQLISQVESGENLAFSSRHLSLFDPGRLSVEEMLVNFNLTLDGATLTIIYSAGLLTILLATGLSIAYWLRLNPKKIMM